MSNSKDHAEDVHVEMPLDVHAEMPLLLVDRLVDGTFATPLSSVKVHRIFSDAHHFAWVSTPKTSTHNVNNCHTCTFEAVD